MVYNVYVQSGELFRPVACMFREIYINYYHLDAACVGMKVFLYTSSPINKMSLNVDAYCFRENSEEIIFARTGVSKHFYMLAIDTAQSI